MKYILIICLALLLVLSGCGFVQKNSNPGTPEKPDDDPLPVESQDEQAEQEEPVKALIIPGINADNLPRIDGSTANIPLIAKLYSGLLEISSEEAETMVSTSGGTGAAWHNLFWDGADILIVYEAPDGLLDEYDDIELEIDPIGRDGLVFLVNKANPVEGLTIKQLQDIYTGKVTDWKDIGGTTGEISAFQRNQESGSQTLFLKLLMGGITPMNPPTELIVGGMEGLIEAVAAYDGSGGAIGYSVFYYADLMYANPDLKLLSVDGVAPSYDSIFTEEYPLINDFYVVIKADSPRGSPERLLRDWLLSEEGAALMKSARYVPAR